jgi:hypothetical protein
MSINNDTARITQELSALRGQINHSSDYHEAVQHFRAAEQHRTVQHFPLRGQTPAALS